MLHRNLVYLASIADVNQNLQTLLPVSNRSDRINNIKHNKIHLIQQKLLS